MSYLTPHLSNKDSNDATQYVENHMYANILEQKGEYFCCNISYFYMITS